MKVLSILLLIIISSLSSSVAQIQADSSQKQPDLRHHQVGFTGLLPVDLFSDSHSPGIGLDHLWSQQGFDKDELIYKKFTFIVNSGIRFHFGKRVIAAGHTFKYGGLLSLYAMPGLGYRPLPKGLIYLSAGPEMNLYRSSVNFGFTSQAFAQYAIDPRFIIGPGIIYRWRSGVNSLWSVGVRGSWFFNR